MHETPKVVSYSGDALMDLLGPVETQYCDVQIQPDPAIYEDPMALVVDFSQVPGFDQVMYEIADDDGDVKEARTVPRSAGEEEATRWRLHDAFGTDITGEYTVMIWLVDDGVKTEPCSTSFRIVYD